MPERNESGNDRGGSGPQSTGDGRHSASSGGGASGPSAVGNRIATWFAASALRIGIALVGFVLLLVALGQLVGMNLLQLVADALSSGVGRWIAIAVFALLLIALALRGFDVTTT